MKVHVHSFTISHLRIHVLIPRSWPSFLPEGVFIMLDSCADFLDRAVKLGVDDAEINNLKALGYDTFGKLRLMKRPCCSWSLKSLASRRRRGTVYLLFAASSSKAIPWLQLTCTVRI